MKVYVIEGASEEWSDSVNWITIAYTLEIDAKIICNILNQLEQKKIDFYHSIEPEENNIHPLTNQEVDLLSKFYPENEVNWSEQSYFTYYEIEVMDGETINIQG